MSNQIRDRLPENLTWCQHIHNWGNAFYYVDSPCSFPVLGPNVFRQEAWVACPICGRKAPPLVLEERVADINQQR
jgi:hypothetical protein